VKRTDVSECIGNVYGKLTVVADGGVRLLGRNKDRRMSQVLCRCECGTEKVVLLNDLRSGKTKTCGFNHPHYEDRSVPAFNFMYDHAYKARAAARDLPFELTKDQFRAITQMNCHYCGVSPSQSTVRSVMTGKFRSEYICNGIDRKDNSRSYTADNCVPCCGVCNHAKHTMGYEDFHRWISRVYNHVAATRSMGELIDLMPPMPK
jgi:hypothetical protein